MTITHRLIRHTNGEDVGGCVGLITVRRLRLYERIHLLLEHFIVVTTGILERQLAVLTGDSRCNNFAIQIQLKLRAFQILALVGFAHLIEADAIRSRACAGSVCELLLHHTPAAALHFIAIQGDDIVHDHGSTIRTALSRTGRKCVPVLQRQLLTIRHIIDPERACDLARTLIICGRVRLQRPARNVFSVRIHQADRTRNQRQCVVPIRQHRVLGLPGQHVHQIQRAARRLEQLNSVLVDRNRVLDRIHLAIDGIAFLFP